ncbi:MAG TPA: hydrolase [Aliidongia sp.]|uniref:hydrolase n=1 Tax=Aliidongia sp. TaxID=1914230 RepID=UPI002DDD4B7F|nr:hydrolase [Aliidongia sp.]HEV2673732.1 hydrolase [Aliidongia sp.]
MRLEVGLRFLAALFALAPLPAVAAEADPPILFVHGNGDSAALWETDIWRFESNGYDPALLSAVDFPHPMARAADDVPEPNRSSTADQTAELKQAVDQVLAATGRTRLVLVGSSRGGYPIRDYIRNDGGRATVALAILAGVPNHGVFALPFKRASEFNGDGPFLSGLNRPPEADPGVRFVTLRSDHLDKFAQRTGRFVGFPYVPTFVNHDGPALEGARNIELPGLDHRESAFHRLAFQEMYRAVTGHDPATLDPTPIDHPVLDGLVSGTENGAPTNLPLVGATVELYEVDPATGVRLGPAVHRRTIDADGRWGPFTGSPTAYYEFVVAAAGYPTSHIYRTPFPRSWRYLDLRLAPLDPAHRARAGSLVTLVRPRGYLAHGRDVFTIDGTEPPGVDDGIPAVDAVTRGFDAGPSRSVPVALNGERMTVRTFPLADDQVVFAEFHY